MAYIYTPFMKKVLHVTERKRKSNVQHYYKSDDFRAGFKVAKWRMFCHSAWLQISPARFKQVYSDKAVQTPYGSQAGGPNNGRRNSGILRSDNATRQPSGIRSAATTVEGTEMPKEVTVEGKIFPSMKSAADL